jgi:hypothetical protein
MKNRLRDVMKNFLYVRKNFRMFVEKYLVSPEKYVLVCPEKKFW